MGDLMRRLHVLGRQELALLAGGEHQLPPFLSNVEEELDEDVIPGEYDDEQGGFVMRTLQDFCLYHEGKEKHGYMTASLSIQD